MPKTLSYEIDVKGGATIRNKLVVPVLSADPGSPVDGNVWLNTTDHALRWRENGATFTAGTSTLDTEAVVDAVAAALTAGNNIDLTYNDAAGTITVDVEALTSADLSDFTAAARAAITVSDTATLDLTYSGGAISGAVLDSPLLEGHNSAYHLNVDNHTAGTTNKLFTATEKTKLAGIASGATANQTDAYLLARTNHTGTQTAATISDFTSAARSAISVTDSATLDLTYTGGALSAEVLDSPLLAGEDGAYYLDVDHHVDGVTNHVFTAADDTKLAGIAAGATANQTDAYLLARANHTGTQTASTISDFTTAARAAITVTDTATADLTYAAGAISVAVLDSPLLNGNNAAYYRSTDNHVDGTTNKVFTATEKTKLAGIASGATANSTDAYLLARANHTGTQTASTISDFAAAVGALSIDADTLQGQTVSDIQTAVTAAIVDSAPGTLDTLNEIAAALGDDPNFATTISTAIASKARALDFSLTGGAATEVVTHNFNTRAVAAQVYVNSGSYEDEEYIIQRTSVNTITVVSEGGNIPAGRHVVITAVGT